MKRKYDAQGRDLLENSVPADLSRISELRREIQEVMWADVGIERSDSGLIRAEVVLENLCGEIESIYEGNRGCVELMEVRNMVSVACLITTSARSRLESRGCHYNVDHPVRDDSNWQHDTIVSKED